MNKKMWLPIILIGISIVLCVMAFSHSISSEPHRYPMFGLIPCVIGVISFIYINKIAEEKNTFLWLTQLLNIAFVIFPLITLLYFMASL